MPNNYVDNKNQWDRLSDLDYLPNFVNAWLAFNAWYRSAYTIEQDRKIINEIKDHHNALRNAILPMLKPRQDDDEERYRLAQEIEDFKSDIALLHKRLEEHNLYSGKGNKQKRITMTDVHIRDRVTTQQRGTFNRISYGVNPVFNTNGQITSIISEVRGANGNIKFSKNQIKYDEDDLRNDPNFSSSLKIEYQRQLMQIYKSIDPKYTISLIRNNLSPIECGSINFECSKEDLFAGIIEIIYLMRCHLFHGELVPTKGASACYEPAFRIVKFFLNYVS